MLYTGIDLGTSSVKLLLIDETGNIKRILVEKYEKNYQKFKRIYPSVKSLFT